MVVKVMRVRSQGPGYQAQDGCQTEALNRGAQRKLFPVTRGEL